MDGDLALDVALLDASALDLALLDAVLSAAPLDDVALTVGDALFEETCVTTDSSTSDSSLSPVTGVCLPQRTTESSTTHASLSLKPPRKHNRIEILKLRDRVAQLEMHLAKLRRQRSSSQQRELALDKRTALPSSAVVVATPPRSQYRELALAEYTKLLHAQALNRKLRDAIAKQQRASSGMHSRLHKQHNSCVQDIGVTIERPLNAPTDNTTAISVEHDRLASTLPSLFARAVRQFHETDLAAHAIGAANDPHAVANASRVTSDAVRGVSFEVTTNTPLSGHYAHFADVLWTRIINSNGSGKVATPPLPFATTHMKHVAMPIRVAGDYASGSGPHDLVLTGVLVLRKFEQAHRVVLTVAGAYVLDGSDLLFREEGWVITAPSTPVHGTASPLTAQQMLYRLYSERQDLSSADASVSPTQPLNDATKRIQEGVVRSLGEKMRDHLVELQGQLVAMSGPTALMALPIANCPIIDAPCC